MRVLPRLVQMEPRRRWWGQILVRGPAEAKAGKGPIYPRRLIPPTIIFTTAPASIFSMHCTLDRPADNARSPAPLEAVRDRVECNLLCAPYFTRRGADKAVPGSAYVILDAYTLTLMLLLASCLVSTYAELVAPEIGFRSRSHLYLMLSPGMFQYPLVAVSVDPTVGCPETFGDDITAMNTGLTRRVEGDSAV